MKQIKNTHYEGERPLFASHGLYLEEVTIHAGESALKECSDIEAVNCRFAWRRKGAEEKKAQVYAWRQEHPEGRKADCHRDTGLDPKTIRKWWDTVPEGHITVKIRPSQALSDLLVEEFKKGL